MKKSFERYTCSACGGVADVESEAMSDTPLPPNWLKMSVEVRTEGKTLVTSQNNIRTSNWDHACSKKCMVLLLTKAISTVVEADLGDTT